jgi:hypothetical protein
MQIDRRHNEAGATSLVGLTLCFLVFAVGLGLSLIAAQNVAVSRVQVVADSAAHATAGFLAGDPRREALSRELQKNSFQCQYEDKKSLQLDPNSGGDADDANGLCAQALSVAESMSAENNKSAHIIQFLVTPDSRGYVDSGGATHLNVLVVVQADSPLAKFPVFCATKDGQNQCDVVATSGARESG